MFSNRENRFLLLPLLLSGIFFLCTASGSDIASDSLPEVPDPVWDPVPQTAGEDPADSHALFFSTLCRLSHTRTVTDDQIRTLFRVLDMTPDSPFLAAMLLAEIHKPGKLKIIADGFADAAGKHPSRPMLTACAADLLQSMKRGQEAIALLQKTADVLADAEERSMIAEWEIPYAEYVLSKLMVTLALEKRNAESEELIGKIESWNLFKDNLFPLQMSLVNLAAMEKTASDRSFLWIFPSEKEKLRKRFRGQAENFLAELSKKRKADGKIDLKQYVPTLILLEQEDLVQEVAFLVLQNLLDDPGDPQSLLFFTEHYRRNAQIMSAVRTWRQLFRLLPDPPFGLYLAYAADLDAAGLKQDALRQYGYALLTAPENPVVRLKAGNALFLAGRYADALELLGNVPYPEAALLAAVSGSRLNRFEESLLHFKRYFTLMKSKGRIPDRYAVFLYAETAQNAKRYELMEEIITGYLKEHPDSAEAMNFLGYMYADGNRKLDEAEKLIRRALALQPGTRDYLDSLAWVFYRKGNYAEALKYIRQALDVPDKPFSKVVLDHAGDIYHALGDNENAVRCWKEALSNYSPEPFDASVVEKKIRKAGGAL